MPHPQLADAVQRLADLKASLNVMKENQSLRGPDNLRQRLATRAATHQTWRQMKGVQLMLHEMNHPGNRPFVIGLGITTSVMLYLYSIGRTSETALKESDYYQRFHAKQH